MSGATLGANLPRTIEIIGFFAGQKEALPHGLPHLPHACPTCPTKGQGIEKYAEKAGQKWGKSGADTLCPASPRFLERGAARVLGQKHGAKEGRR